MVIGWCKKLNNEVVSHQRTQPFIIWCLQEKHHSVPCFGRGQPSWPPSSGLVSRTSLLAMASEDAPPVIDLLEEEEEEWPDAESTESRRSPEVRRQNKWHL